MDWRDVLAASHEALRRAVAGVPAGAWSLPTPCADWNVAQVLRHAAGDQIGYAAALTGGPWPSEDPFAPSATEPEDPGQLVEQAVTASAAAYATVADDAESVPVPLPTGPFPAEIAAGACALDAAIHAWDIAVATGQPSPLSDELAVPLRRVADHIVEPLRAFAYAPVVDDPASTGPAAELLKYLGRRVSAWEKGGRY